MHECASASLAAAATMPHLLVADKHRRIRRVRAIESERHPRGKREGWMERMEEGKKEAEERMEEGRNETEEEEVTTTRRKKRTKGEEHRDDEDCWREAAGDGEMDSVATRKERRRRG